MPKRVVVVVASGETERRALPHLLAHLETGGVTLVDVRIPPRNLPLKPDMGEKLIKAAWFSSLHEPRTGTWRRGTSPTRMGSGPLSIALLGQ